MRCPLVPRRIGVITSPSGAAIRDILHVLARRFPAARVLIYPVPVQGAAAAPAIVAALELAAARAECDVLILARGGGSLEDLWAFNDERVARAITAAPIPIVTGIGHEVDFTIADFVADVRAPTPSGAAQLVVPDVLRMAAAAGAASPALAVGMRRVRCEPSSCASRRSAPSAAGPSGRAAVQHTSGWMNWRRGCSRACRRDLRPGLARLRRAARALQAVSPLATLARGFAVVTRSATARCHGGRDSAVGETLTRASRQAALRATVIEPRP